MQQGTISWLDYDLRLVDKKWILYDNQRPTRLVVGPRRSSKALPKAKLASKKGHGHCLVACCRCLIHYSFLSLGETITSEKYAQQIDEMHWKTQHLQPILVNRLLYYNAWSHVIQPRLQKLNKLGHKVLIHPPYSSDLSLTDYHVFKHFDNFLQGKCFHNQQEAESAFQEFTEF